MGLTKLVGPIPTTNPTGRLSWRWKKPETDDFRLWVIYQDEGLALFADKPKVSFRLCFTQRAGIARGDIHLPEDHFLRGMLRFAVESGEIGPFLDALREALPNLTPSIEALLE